MDAKKQITKILDREIDRKEFFMYLGAAIMSIVGISSILKAFGEKQEESSNRGGLGYNSGIYGGRKNK